ncbi:MAG TPA: tetratricopeptide repeat protein [Pyrinomonadaceae bacterium]|nr:tetratricopeptide repeat protein [Pyrinomonadaceae bacterium]
MTKTLTTFFLILCAFIFPSAVRAQQTGANLPAWQVTSFDVSVNASGASAADRSIAARATISARNVGGAAGRTLTLRLNTAAKIESASVGGQTASVNPGKDAAAQLQTAQIALPAPVPVGGSVTATLDYRLPVAENTGLAAVTPLGLQFLPLSQWYPSPNSPIAPRGADYAPVKLTFTGLPSGDAVVSSGKASGAGFEQPLNAQPFFLTGRWETVEGTGDARGVTAMLRPGATAEERKNAEALVALAGAARAFYATLLGPAPDAPVRLVGVRRGAGFEMGGTLLLNNAAFTRRKLDSVTATQVADAVARLWVGGTAGVAGEGAGALREGLPRYLAALFLEKQFGRPAAEAEWMRMALLYAPVAARDAPLSKLTPSFDTYFNSATHKGALAWRILANAVGQEAFLGALRAQLAQGGPQALTLAGLRARLAQAGGDRASILMSSLFDLQTDTDLLVGLPVERAGAWVSNLRNTGSFDVEVTVQALTDRGERLTTTARIPAKDFGEAQFKTASKIVRVEVDPEKLYPQTNFANDVVPQGPGLVEAVEQARIQLGQQPARAESLAREVLARAPASEEARVVLARALLEQNRLDEAEREFNAASAAPLPVPATLAWADIGLGEIALKRNRAADAVRLFDAAARAEAEYASTLAARAARIRAEAAAGAPPVDEQIKAAVAELDKAIQTGRKAEIDALIVGGELTGFARGLSGIPPEAWQTRVLRTEQLDPNRVAADVLLSTRVTGRTSEGPAVYVFARTPAGWKLAEIPIFEVR